MEKLHNFLSKSYHVKLSWAMFFASNKRLSLSHRKLQLLPFGGLSLRGRLYCVKSKDICILIVFIQSRLRINNGLGELRYKNHSKKCKREKVYGM